MKLYSLIAGIFFLSTACAENSKYRVGQEWQYKTRPAEENSTLKILKIEEYPKTGKIIHISIRGLKIKNPGSPTGFAENLSHIPISEEALKKSVTGLKNETGKKPDSLEMDGYAHWKKEFDKGNAGIFTIPVSEIVSSLEESITSGNQSR